MFRPRRSSSRQPTTTRSLPAHRYIQCARILLDNNVQVVFVAFCADWCPFSRRLKPIFEESARVFKAESPDASVAWAIVDSVRQADVVDKYLCVLFFYLATYSSRIR